MGKKLKIGWFSFTCCEDSSIIFLELLNEHFFEWKEVLDIRHARILKKYNKLEKLDVAFVEGAIATPADARKLEKIRAKAKKLVAIGACAITGMPSGQRNIFDEKTRQEIAFLLKKFKHSEKVSRLDEIVKVDDAVPGCPMEENKFLEILNKYLMEFGVV